MLQKMKDKALSQGAKIAINKQIEAYGKILSLNLDSKQKSITMEVMLEGEMEALGIHIDEYELKETNGQHQLIIKGVKTSRVWINTVASAYLVGKAFDVPDEYGKMFYTIMDG